MPDKRRHRVCHRPSTGWRQGLPNLMQVWLERLSDRLIVSLRHTRDAGNEEAVDTVWRD